MSDTAPSPSPAPQPMPATPPASPLAVLTMLVVLAASAAGGYALFRHLKGAVERPPSAVLTGSFLPGNAVPQPAGREAPESPLGVYVLDASKSDSAGPIRWKVQGGGATILPMTPAGKGPQDSVAFAYVFDASPRTFVAVATGTESGQPTADAAVWVGTTPTPGPAPATAAFKGEIDTTYQDGLVTGIAINPAK